jgi:hypothetical protein
METMMIDFPLNLSDDKENWTWFKGSLWLSLDRFERFWSDVGLALENGEAVKSAVRDALGVKFASDAEWRAAYFADPDAPEDLEAPDPTKELPQICFRRINETAGAQDAECIARWLQGPVLGAIKEWTDHPWHMWHNAWNSLLYQLGKEDPSQLTYHYGLSHDIARRLVEIAARFRSEIDVNRERVKAADEEPLSGWDAVAYADYRWECPEPSPLDGLWTHLGYICFERAWPEVMRCVPPTNMDALVKWGRANLSRDNIYRDYVAFPDDVRAAWHQAWLN